VTAGQFIGVDVGGTKVATAGLCEGVLSEPVVQPTEKASAEALLDQIVAAIDAVRGPDARAVGIGVPSVVEFATGRIRYSVNIPLADLPLRELLSQRLGLPVFVENDASCAALSEAYDGGRCISPDLVMFTLGTGVGGGVVIGGKLFRGVTGAAPEMGHIIIGLDLTDGAPEPAPTFPQPGSLEWLATGGALAKLGARHGYADGRAVVAAAQAGEPGAIDCVRILGERLGIGIATAINLFDPGEIVIGGGVSAAGELLVAPAERVARRFALPGVGTVTKIRLARRGWEAGVLGAALLAFQEAE
jgi:glucokinase